MRKHRATGKSRGGARPGAGHPKGVFQPLPRGAVEAVKACRLRVPAGASEDAAKLADLALQRIVDVMVGQNIAPFVSQQDVLKAASIVRNEVCGPVTQKLEHSFSDMTDEQLEAKYRALTAKEVGSAALPAVTLHEPQEESEG